MKKSVKIILVEALFFAVIVFIVAKLQFFLTFEPAVNSMIEHQISADNAIAKYKKSEEDLKQRIDEVFHISAEYVSFALKKGLLENSPEALNNIADKLDVDGIYICEKDEKGGKYKVLKASDNAPDLNVIDKTNDWLGESPIGEGRFVVTVVKAQRIHDTFAQAYSWKNTIINSEIGKTGYTIVADKDTMEVTYCLDTDLLGKKIKPWQKDDQSFRQDIERITAIPVTDRHYSDTPYTTMMIGSMRAFGSLIEVDDSYVICVLPFRELILDYVINSCNYLLVFLFVTVLFILYIFFSEERRRTDEAYAEKLKTHPFLGLVLVACISLYITKLNTVSQNLLNCQTYANDTIEMTENLEESLADVQKKYEELNLIKCQIAAEILTELPEYRTREGMHEISSLLNVKYTYLFDQSGRVSVTDSPYDQFQLSRNEEDQSYAFRVLLEGTDYVIQEPMIDDSSGRLMQYIGVSIRNKEDLADGFVQIAIASKELQQLNKTINMSTRLGEVKAGENGFSFLVGTDKIVKYSGKKNMVGMSIDELEIKKRQMKDKFSGYLTLFGEEYYAAVKKTDSNETFFVVVPTTEKYKWRKMIIVFMSIIAFLCMILMTRIANKDYEEKPIPKKADSRRQKKKEHLEKKFEHLHIKAKNIWGIEINEGLERRWHHEYSSWKDRTPESKIRTIARMVVILFSVLLVGLNYFGLLDEYSNSILQYILEGNWEKSFNIFSITASLIIICLIFVSVLLLERVLYWVSKVSNPKTETLCHLLYSLVKYGAVIFAFYYCLALFGLDTKTLVASAGILTAVIGFGANQLISDVIAGLFIVFENQFSVGDFVSVGDWSGIVTEIGIRTTRIAKYDDVKSFNNSEIKGLVNYMSKDIGLIHLEMPISYKESIDRVVDVFDRELPGMGNRIEGAEGDPVYDGIQRFDESSVCLRFHLPVQTSGKFAAQRAFNREMYAMFNRNNIEIPYNRFAIEYSHAEIPTSPTENK